MDTTQKNKVLNTLEDLLMNSMEDIISANKRDIAASSGLSESLLERLKIDKNKIAGMITCLKQAIQLEDPEGKTLYSHQHENGLKIENRTVPFGVILVIYESRPDVTIEAVVTAFKAGNKVILKGGEEARQTNLILVQLWHEALSAHKLSKEYVTYLDFNKEETQDLIKNNKFHVDLIIPRGGEGLINFVRRNTGIPMIIGGRGNNFLYIDKESDFDMALKIIINGKQKVSVCNALDKVLIHEQIPHITTKIENLVAILRNNTIDIRGDKNICKISGLVRHAGGEAILREEFLSPAIFLSLVKNTDEAINMINKYSGGHSASLVTSNRKTADMFQSRVDCAAVYHNASTRFTDGGQFGLGTEIAISTQKLHFRGPVSINQLVTNKWFIYGDGQIRG